MVDDHPVAYVPATSLKLQELEDGLAVFSPLSWDTHLLNESAAAVLESVMQAPRTEQELTDLLAELLDESGRAEAARYARSIITELSQLNLITARGARNGAAYTSGRGAAQ